MARYKIKFKQYVSGVELVEAVVSAKNEDDAVEKYLKDEFFSKLVVKREVDEVKTSDALDIERI